MAAIFSTDAHVIDKTVSPNGFTTGTMCCWFYWITDNAVPQLVMRVANGVNYETRNMGVLSGTANNPMFWDKYNSSETALTSPSFNISANTGAYANSYWNWVAWKWTGGTTSLIRAARYADTTITSSWDKTASDTYSGNFSAITIGNLYSGAGQGFRGYIAHFRIWSAELSDAELLAEMKSASPVRTANLYSSLALSTDKTDTQGLTWSANAGVTYNAAYDPDLSIYTSAPTISDAGDEAYFHGETGITITGTGFGASQGNGTVKISPTDNVSDAAAVAQTVTSWSDTSIAFTAVQGFLQTNATLYLFVTENGTASNAAGHAVKFKYRGPMVPRTLLQPQAATTSGTGTVA